MRKFFVLVPLLLMVVTGLCACTSRPATPDTKNALFFDDFSQSSSGWTQLKNDSGSIEYANNHYIILVNKPSTLLLATPGKSFPGDVSIEVDASKIGGSDDNYIGVLCHYQNPDNYYMLIITSDGYSGIAMRKDGQDTLISPGLNFLKMQGIKTGNTTNHIRADCVGEKLTLYANGKQVSLAYDHSLTGGQAGLALRTGNLEGIAEVQFDNFIVNKVAQP
ncbi:MAG: hypothetical protein WCE68_12425 [Anaerolineales bacterium]